MTKKDDTSSPKEAKENTTQEFASEAERLLEEPVLSSDALGDELTRNKKLVRIAVLLLIFAAACTVSLLLFLSKNTATPQRAQNIELVEAEKNLKENPKSAAAYEELARAQLANDQLDEAQKTAEEGLKKTKSGSLNLVLADTLRIKKDYKQAILTYDKAEAYYREESGLEKEASEDRQIRDEFLAQVAYGRGLCEIATGDKASGQKDLEASVRYAPTSSTVWVALGDFYASVSEVEKATDAYRQALRYVPDYQPALEGLKRLGVEQ